MKHIPALAYALAVALVMLLPFASAHARSDGSNELHRQQARTYPGYCDVANLPPHVLGSRDAKAYLKGRIAACDAAIKTALTTPTPGVTPFWEPVPTPAPAQSPEPDDCYSYQDGSALYLYGVLGECFTFLGNLKGNAAPTPGPTPTPLPNIVSVPTFYVFAVGGISGDANYTGNVLMTSAVSRLRDLYRAHVAHCQTGAGLGCSPKLEPTWIHDGSLSVVSRPDWTSVSSFTQQCQLDASTKGALVIEGPYDQLSTNNWFLYQKNWQVITSSFDLMECGDSDHNPATAPMSLLNIQNATGRDHEYTVPLGIIASILALYANDKTTTTFSVPESPPPGHTPNPAATSAVTQTGVNLTLPLIVGSLASSSVVQAQSVPSVNASTQANASSFGILAQYLLVLNAQCYEDFLYNKSFFTEEKYPDLSASQRASLLTKGTFEFAHDYCNAFDDFFYSAPIPGASPTPAAQWPTPAPATQ